MRAFFRSSTATSRVVLLVLAAFIISGAAPRAALAESHGSAILALGADPTSRMGNKPTTTATPDTRIGRESNGGGLQGNIYRAYDVPLTVTFDPAVWDVSENERAEGYEGISLTSDQSIGEIEALSGETSMSDCIDEPSRSLSDLSNVTNVQPAGDLEPPATVDGAEQRMVTFDVSRSDGVVPYMGYLECRALIAGKRLLRVELAAPAELLDAAMPTWADLVAGIDAPNLAAPPTPAPAATSQTDDEFENVDGHTYTSPEFGYSITWPDGFEPYEASYSPDDQMDDLWIGDDASDFMLYAYAIEDSPEDCIGLYESLYTEANGYTDVQLAVDANGDPIRKISDHDAFARYTFTFTINGNSIDQTEYLECREDPSGQFVLDMSFQTATATFDETSAILEAILASIEFA